MASFDHLGVYFKHSLVKNQIYKIPQATSSKLFREVKSTTAEKNEQKNCLHKRIHEVLRISMKFRFLVESIYINTHDRFQCLAHEKKNRVQRRGKKTNCNNNQKVFSAGAKLKINASVGKRRIISHNGNTSDKAANILLDSHY